MVRGTAPFAVSRPRPVQALVRERCLIMNPQTSAWLVLAASVLAEVLGTLWYQEATSVLRLAGLGCIVVGVIALNLSAK
ncbi:MAG: hypothetical protein C0487_18240 [Leptothrix sp. (in: Bacteria)]|nr:hypothetical protein [Leptothrix sp. (in: b-proteobacteria)]